MAPLVWYYHQGSNWLKLDCLTLLASGILRGVKSQEIRLSPNQTSSASQKTIMDHPAANSTLSSENCASFSLFVYRPLQEHDFTRILHLHPSALPEAPLRCDLSHV